VNYLFCISLFCGGCQQKRCLLKGHFVSQIRKFFRVRIWSRLHFCAKTEDNLDNSARNKWTGTVPPARLANRGKRMIGRLDGLQEVSLSLSTRVSIQVPQCAKFCTPTWYY